MAIREDEAARLQRLRARQKILEVQTSKAVRPYREDGYVNLMNRYGTSQDNSEGYVYQKEPLVPDIQFTGIQKLMLRSNLRDLLDVVFRAGIVSGEIAEEPKYKLKFNPLWSLSEKEQADVDKSKADTELAKAQTAQVYVDMQALDPSEVRKKVTHANGIGNNCCYPVFYRPEGVDEMQQCGSVNLNRGLYGEGYVSCEDYNGRRVGPLYRVSRFGVKMEKEV